MSGFSYFGAIDNHVAHTRSFDSRSMKNSANEGLLVDFKPAGSAKGNGNTSAYSKAAAFGDPLTLVATAIDLKADYDAKNGASTEMAGVFYFVVASTKIIAK